MSPITIQEMIVADAMKRWPRTIELFNLNGMACPGCVMSTFMTIDDVAAAYQIDQNELAAAILTIVADPGLAIPRLRKRLP